MYVHTCCGKKKVIKKSIQRRDQLNFTLFSPPSAPPLPPSAPPPTQALNNDRSLKGAAFLKASANFIIKGM